MLIHEYHCDIRAFSGSSLADMLTDCDHSFGSEDIRTLVRGKASIHGTSSSLGESALHVAVQRKPAKIAIALTATLLEQGCDPNHLSQEKGETPLDTAVRHLPNFADEDAIYLLNLLISARARLLAAKDTAAARCVEDSAGARVLELLLKSGASANGRNGVGGVLFLLGFFLRLYALQ